MLGTVVALSLAIVAVVVSLSGALLSVVLLAAAIYVWRAADRRIGASENWTKGRVAEEAVGLE
ncbi:MAG: hypothetical protein WD067_10405, partial [Gaiellaceae bacterium]